MPKLTLLKAGQELWSHDFPKDYITIGRHSFADVPLDSPMVSRHHAVIRFSAQEGGYIVEDSGAKNGVEVNGDEVKRIVLVDGDKIQVGGYQLVFNQIQGDRELAPNFPRARAKSGIDEAHGTFEIPRITPNGNGG